MRFQKVAWFATSSLRREAFRCSRAIIGFATLAFLRISSFADCPPSGDFVWSLHKKGTLDEHAIALDSNGTLYVDGDVVKATTTVDNWLTDNAIPGTTIWKVTNSGGTVVAAVYQNKGSKKWDLVLSGTLVTGNQFSTYSAVTAHWNINNSAGNPLLALKRSGSGLADGTLLLKCETKVNCRDQDWFFQESWVASGLNQPVHFTFVPGQQLTMLITELGTFRIRVVQNGSLLEAPMFDLSSLLTRPGGQHGLMGIACHPKFDAPTPRRFVYIYGTSSTPTPFPNDPYRPGVLAWTNRIYRMEVNASLTPIATPAPVPNDLYVYAGNTTPMPSPPDPPIESLDHTGGCLRSYSNGTNNYLLLSTGCIDHENNAGHMSGRPQDARVLVGKMLRWEIEDDGDLVIPSDNPFERWTPTLTPPAGGTPIPTPTLRYPRREVIASGFRNPYTFAIRPGPTPGVPIEAWVSTVGGIEDRGFEEVDRVSLYFTAGGSKDDHKNYGFPRVEGNSDGSTPWPTQTPAYEYYTGCDSGCSPNNKGGDLSEVGSLPYVPFSDLKPPSIYYRRFYAGFLPQPHDAGSVGGGAFISKSRFPSRYLGDFFFLDWIHGSLTRIPKSTIDAGGPYRVGTIDELKWWYTGDENRQANYDMLEGPDGALYYTWYRFSTGAGGINRFRYVE